ncbi:hypothetical protein BPORC_1729 [Bifidobacterium porcinum]|nr:hypothetical protein BPORC_1729 [Bifidobacterium porcinum]
MRPLDITNDSPTEPNALWGCFVPPNPNPSTDAGRYVSVGRKWRMAFSRGVPGHPRCVEGMPGVCWGRAGGYVFASSVQVRPKSCNLLPNSVE